MPIAGKTHRQFVWDSGNAVSRQWSTVTAYEVSELLAFRQQQDSNFGFQIYLRHIAIAPGSSSGIGSTFAVYNFSWSVEDTVPADPVLNLKTSVVYQETLPAARIIKGTNFSFQLQAEVDTFTNNYRHFFHIELVQVQRVI